jgi:hypothetical protein
LPFLLYKKNLQKPLYYIGVFGMQQLFSTKMTMKSGRLSFFGNFQYNPDFVRKWTSKVALLPFPLLVKDFSLQDLFSNSK